MAIIRKKDAYDLAIHDNKPYLVTVKEVYSVDLNENGTTGGLQLLITDDNNGVIYRVAYDGP